MTEHASKPRRRVRRIVARVALGVLALIAVGVIVVQVRSGRTFDAPYPAIRASDDPAVIARGRYLAYGPAHCVDCHGSPEQVERRQPGDDILLSGGAHWELPVGTIHAPNLTADPRTGIGARSDGELARALRHGVGADGRAMLPFMPFAHLSDEDLTAVISFLRTQPAVEYAVPRFAPNFLGKVLLAFVHEPRGPSRPVAARVERGPTVAYGRYLVDDVGNCGGCHSQLDLKDGSRIGPYLGGGAELPSHRTPGKVFVSPNLTPHPTDGWITAWDEDGFVARFRAGAVDRDSPMPWTSFGTMTDDDLRAIYRYLRTVEPAAGGPRPGEPVVARAP